MATEGQFLTTEDSFMVAIYQPKCRSCGSPRVSRARGLCCRCYRTPAISKRFPSLSKYGSRGEPVAAVREPAPTDHPPGSKGKIEVLRQRVALSQMLWCAADAGMPDPPPKPWFPPVVGDRSDQAEAA